jgi:hypothetical protein
MKTNPLLVPFLAMLCIFSACSKKGDTPTTTPEPDYSQCLLSSVQYNWSIQMPYNNDPFTLEYDNLKRVKQRKSSGFIALYSYEPGKIIQIAYINSVVDSNLTARYVYTLDNNDRIVSSIYYSYYKPKSMADSVVQDKTTYEYNAEGYLIAQKTLAYGTKPYEERKFIYQDGNLVQRENTHYDLYTNPGAKLGTDTITYTYDNTLYFPEAVYLYEATDVKTGKQNKNNVTGIQLKKYRGPTAIYDEYKSIQYTYAVKGKRLEKVTMTATTLKNVSINTTFGFGYNCN